MGELAIIYGILILSAIIFTSLMFYNDGIFIKSAFGNIIVCLFVVLISFVNITSFPSNYFVAMIISFLIGLIGVVGSIMIKVKEEKLDISRVLIIASIIGNLAILIS